jgi:site-specific DNA-cytosine methylase
MSEKLILDVQNMDQGDLDMVFGGPPCQGFSLGGET